MPVASTASMAASLLIRRSVRASSTAAIVAPFLDRIAIAFVPAWPLPLPAMYLPSASCNPAGGVPVIWSCTGFASVNGVLGVRATVSLDAV